MTPTRQCHMGTAHGQVFLISSIVWSHRFRPSPSWLVVTAVGRNCYSPVIIKHTLLCVISSNPCEFIGLLQLRQNGRDGVSNHQLHDCLLNRLFRRRSKKTSKFRVTGLCAGNSPGTLQGHLSAGVRYKGQNVQIKVEFPYFTNIYDRWNNEIKTG